MSPSRRRFPKRSARNAPPSWTTALWRAAVLAVCAIVPLGLMGTALRAVSESSLLYVRNVEVVGNERLADGDVLAAAGLDRPTRILHVAPQAVEQQLEAHPWIVGATVVATWRGLVHITVVEALPALVVAGPGGVRLVDDAGRTIRDALPEDLAEHPLVAGVVQADGTDAVDPALVSDALGVASLVAAQGELPAVRELQYDAVYGWRLILADGAEIALGNDRIGDRIARLVDVYRTLSRQGLAAQRVAVDTASLRHIAVALRSQTQEEP